MTEYLVNYIDNFFIYVSIIVLLVLIFEFCNMSIFTDFYLKQKKSINIDILLTIKIYSILNSNY